MSTGPTRRRSSCSTACSAWSTRRRSCSASCSDRSASRGPGRSKSGQTAAVVGRDFSFRVLERILGNHPTLDEDLREAQRLELIAEVSAYPERDYTFKHALVQEAVYQTLLVRHRRELHAAVAEALEAI